MSTKKISAGDTLTVGDLTDDHLGAEIEVGVPEGTRYRLTLRRIEDNRSTLRVLAPEKESERVVFLKAKTVTVITPPPVVQPDEPTELGQCIRIEGDDNWLAVVMDQESCETLLDQNEMWWNWGEVLDRAAGRQIIVSDPPRWPNETPEAPERIKVGEWPDDDTHLRDYEWIDRDGEAWRWYAGADEGWSYFFYGTRTSKPLDGPWTRGERVE